MADKCDVEFDCAPAHVIRDRTSQFLSRTRSRRNYPGSRFACPGLGRPAIEPRALAGARERRSPTMALRRDGLAASSRQPAPTADYSPSLRFPWLAAEDARPTFVRADHPTSKPRALSTKEYLLPTLLRVSLILLMKKLALG